MGSICATSIANIFIHILESSWIEKYPHELYKRYIDDIFIIPNLDTLDKQFDSLKLNTSSGNIETF